MTRCKVDITVRRALVGILEGLETGHRLRFHHLQFQRIWPNTAHHRLIDAGQGLKSLLDLAQVHIQVVTVDAAPRSALDNPLIYVLDPVRDHHSFDSEVA